MNKIPTPIVTRELCLSAAPAQLKMMGAFTVEQPTQMQQLPPLSQVEHLYRSTQVEHLPQPIQMQQLLPSSQMEPLTHSPQVGHLPQPFEGRKLPKPIQTRQLIEPSGTVKLPALRSMFSDVRKGQRQNRAIHNQTQPDGQPSHDMSAADNGYLQRTLPMGPMDGVRPQNRPRQGRPPNPYAIRAVEIGLRQSHSGTEHVSDLLSPPNWQPGQEPIDEGEAKQLFDEAREIARRSADDFAKSIQQGEGHDQRLADFKKRCQAQRKLDELVLSERCAIRKAYLQYKREQADVINWQRDQYKQSALHQDCVPRHVLRGFHQGIHRANVLGGFANGNDTFSPPVGAFHLQNRLQSMGKRNTS